MTLRKTMRRTSNDSRWLVSEQESVDDGEHIVDFFHLSKELVELVHRQLQVHAFTTVPFLPLEL